MICILISILLIALIFLIYIIGHIIIICVKKYVEKQKILKLNNFYNSLYDGVILKHKYIPDFKIKVVTKYKDYIEYCFIYKNSIKGKNYTETLEYIYDNYVIENKTVGFTEVI